MPTVEPETMSTVVKAPKPVEISGCPLKIRKLLLLMLFPTPREFMSASAPGLRRVTQAPASFRLPVKPV